jgi:hypothetical protein
MESKRDTCPKCEATEDDTNHVYLGSYNVECGECEHVWNLRVQLGLSPDYCECCGHRLSWGCGHSYDQEHAAVQHRRTAEHYAGDCDCFTSGPGYIPPKLPHTLYPTFAEWIAYLDSTVPKAS